MARFETVEARYSTHLFEKASKNLIPISGTFELSPVCNFDCKMCYVHMTSQQIRDSGKKMMKYEDWICLAKQAKEEGLLYLLLTGGEPFLYPKFKELFQELSEMGFIISINSNGSMINEEIVEWLTQNTPNRINITLYGASNETYERLTGIKNGFDRVSHAIDLLKKAGISVKLNCSLTPYNMNDLEEMVRYAEERELIIEIATYMFPAIRLSKVSNCNDYRFTPKQTAHFMLDVYKYQYGEEIAQNYAKNILSGSIPCSNEECLDVLPNGQIKCRAGKAAFWMTWHGYMTPCGMMVEPGVQYKGDNFKEAWKEINEKVSNIRLSGKCSSCKNSNVCHVCAAMAYAETGTFEQTPTYLCEMVNALREEALDYLDKKK